MCDGHTRGAPTGQNENQKFQSSKVVGKFVALWFFRSRFRYLSVLHPLLLGLKSVGPRPRRSGLKRTHSSHLSNSQWSSCRKNVEVAKRESPPGRIFKMAKDVTSALEAPSDRPGKQDCHRNVRGSHKGVQTKRLEEIDEQTFIICLSLFLFFVGRYGDFHSPVGLVLYVSHTIIFHLSHKLIHHNCQTNSNVFSFFSLFHFTLFLTFRPYIYLPDLTWLTPK